MPRRVNHDERRQCIARAVCRIAATEGLEAVSVRGVAVEAGMSAPLVQRYFPEKTEMLRFAITDLNAEAARVAEKRINALFAENPYSERALIRAMLAELLPLDEARRTLLLAHQAYFTRAIQDPLVASAYHHSIPELTAYIRDALSREKDAGNVPPATEPEPEAFALVAMTIELGNDMLMEERSIDSTTAVLDYHLQRLFPHWE